MTRRTRTALLVFTLTLALLNSACLAGDAFFAATGTWTAEPDAKDLDPVAAAEAATKDMMAKFAKAGKTPKAVIFLERVKDLPPQKGKAIGDKVKATAGGAATFGHGGAGTYGVTMADVADQAPTFMVIGLAGDELDVAGYLSEGGIQYSYINKKTRDAAEAGDEKAQSEVEKEKALRETCFAKGKALGEQVKPLEKTGFVVLLGALHNNWHVTFAEGFVDGFNTETPLVGGVGKWNDYVYNDGQCAVGQLAITVQGDLKVAAAGKAAKDTWKKAVLQSEMAEIKKATDAKLGETKPEVLLTFCCVTRLRNPKLSPADKLSDLRTLWGQDVPIFGGFCGGEIGWDLDGKLTAGGDRLTVIAVAGNDE